jgi:hypothetical protein
MMSLLENIDLKNMKDNVLAKANNGIEFFILLLLKQEAIQSRRQFKAGGNSKQEAIQNGNQLN